MDENPYKSPLVHDGRKLRRWPPILAIAGVAISGAFVGGVFAGGLCVLASALWWYADPTSAFDDRLDLQLAGFGFGSVVGWAIALIAAILRAVRKSH
jgi:hypothetical protein